MKPDSLGNGQFRRIGHLTEAISVRIGSASVDAPDASSERANAARVRPTPLPAAVTTAEFTEHGRLVLLLRYTPTPVLR